MTGAKPEEQPNEPRINPKEGAMSKGFAGDAKVNVQTQKEHKSIKIDSEHIFGKKVEDKKPMHMDPKGASLHQASGYGNQLKVKMPKKSRLPKP